MTGATTVSRERIDWARLFNLVADGYDDPALRFFSFMTEELVAWVKPTPGDKALDLCCGTGALSLAVGEQGRAIGIDLAEARLARTPIAAAPSRTRTAD